MTHEFKKLIQGYLNARHLGLSCVSATVVALDGSSYRRPGVRMLINEQGSMTGAVSGGCVENEILKQSSTVFATGRAKMITYDGRYRLGCEGTLYILIEKFEPAPQMITRFEQVLSERAGFEISSRYEKKHGEFDGIGSHLTFGEGEVFRFDGGTGRRTGSESRLEFVQRLKPGFRLMIFGAEHDAAHLSLTASHLGWEVTVVTAPSNPSALNDFPGAEYLLKKAPEDIPLDGYDEETAVVLMSHSYVKDLSYLMAMKDARPLYIGLLGPSNRRERMLNDLLEKYPELDDDLFSFLYGPAGLNIGAETPEEIALSICSEILAVKREQEPKSLKEKTGPIHQNLIG